MRYVKEFEKLQDKLHPFPSEQAKRIIERELKKPLNAVFSEFNEKPVAAASVAQVHKAKLKTGEIVIVKVQRPKVKEIMERVKGLITIEKKGNYGFGYDPIFFYPPLKKTFAELLPAEKNRVSHRGRSLKKLKAFLLLYLESEKKT